MGSNDGVTVYQSVLGRCVCTAELDSFPAPDDVARNLLLGNRDSEKLRIFPSRKFKPWYDDTTLIPLSFKFLPQKLSLTPALKSNLLLQDGRQSLSSTSDHLLEFSPTYSGKSCIKHPQLNSSNCYIQSGFDEGSDVSRSSNLQQLCHSPGQNSPWCKGPTLGDNSSGKSKLLNKVLNPLNPSLAKSLWCASPSHINCRKRKEKQLVLEKLKETKLHQVKEQYGLNYHQRGKWIVCTRKNSLKGKNLTVEQLWKKVRSLIKEGHLPYCNAKLQSAQEEVWVYCDFGHSLKVRSTLEKALGNVGPFSFFVHPVGAVMDL